LKTFVQETTAVISLKKYWEMDPTIPGDKEAGELLKATLECYCSALLVMGKSGDRVCPPMGSELQHGLADLARRLSHKATPALVRGTGKHVEEQLQQWGNHTAEYFKAKANDVKELLLVLARTAESIGERDQRNSKQFAEFTIRLEKVADLEDLAQVRTSLMERATELKNRVDQMARDSNQSVAELRAEVSTYEARLKTVEQLALRDSLTGLANRRNVEDRMEWRVSHQQVFCAVFLDLNRFKEVNDVHGHTAGDNLLKQFAEELRSNTRPTDVVGRWGGDEFILVLDCDLAGARAQIERLQKWAFGEYTVKLNGDADKIKIRMDASIGVAQWQPGESAQQVIERSDAAMYKDKKLSKKANA
jgi:diguanylate cyclase (GGDEF)-like protein